MRHEDRQIGAQSMTVRVTSNTFPSNTLRSIRSTTGAECSPTATWSGCASASLAPSPTSRAWVLGLLCVVFNAMCSADTYASDSADVLKGKQLARIACSDCHVVASDSDAPPLRYAPAPRFDVIASRPGTSEKSLQRFITATHWDGETMPMTMPKPDLIKPQVVALSRYIMSLRKR
jgi:mono/diheme cytochrome c family protein